MKLDTYKVTRETLEKVLEVLKDYTTVDCEEDSYTNYDVIEALERLKVEIDGQEPS